MSDEDQLDPVAVQRMIGKLVLVGIDHFDACGDFVRCEQLYGNVLRVNAREGLVIRSGLDGTEHALPPFLDEYKPAAPGTYHLRSVQAEVVDPDYLATWECRPRRSDPSPVDSN